MIEICIARIEFNHLMTFCYNIVCLDLSSGDTFNCVMLKRLFLGHVSRPHSQRRSWRSLVKDTVSKYYKMLLSCGGNKTQMWQLWKLFGKGIWVYGLIKTNGLKFFGNSCTMSRDLRIRLIQFKILHRCYWTLSMLHRLGLKDSAL